MTFYLFQVDDWSEWEPDMGNSFSKAHPLSLANHLYARFKKHPALDQNTVEKFVKFVLENVDPETTVDDFWWDAQLKPIHFAARYDFFDVVKKLAPKYDIGT